MLDQTPVQIAWVTRDLDATEMALTTLLGAKKWVRMPGVHFASDTCTFRGRPADFVADISLSYAGDTQLELIAPVSGDSIYTEFLDRAGAGLHHICIEAPGAEVNVLLGKGIARIADVIQELKKINYSGLVAVEYEKEGSVEEDIRTEVAYARTLL